MGSLYWKSADFAAELEQEISQKTKSMKTIGKSAFYCEEDLGSLTWSQQAWQACHELSFQSIKEAAKKLKDFGGHGIYWQNASENHFRRGELILAELAKFPQQALTFSPGGLSSAKKLGQFLLLTENSLLVSTKLSPPLPLGQIVFQEDPKPPSRAYLKLWELLTVYGLTPDKQAVCVELGSSPGGWTYVLAPLVKKLTCVDRAPLTENLPWPKHVEYVKQDAFNYRPEAPVDWLFSDLICAPERLLELVLDWQAKKLAKNFVCTIKFKGQTDFSIVEKFLKIPGSWTKHLYNNKHEITWVCTQTPKS